ncbi:MAG: hypothetical protein ACLT1C_08335 [Weissella confusa]|uniref:hypothetical protein n=1 Tax=Weissella confusa TaxID=1583 RepID=UPI000DCA8743|nr:hypothetical protein [Weissella confusa]MBD5833837.1 hypothetical protein [Weissella confusa]MBJ7631103.1 hypothetical protein [Weissella confusa]MBJ7635294.1 hypothetical protein [Weissella confusa]RAU05921.1 hypothetical protein DEJ53_08745 [Weissella confusa]TGE42486.1 hypothetical protein C6P26_08375 [Weissella confusa]
MFKFMEKILSDVYLTSGESFILNEINGEAEGMILGSHNAGGRKVRYAVNESEIAAVREHW